MMCDDSNFLVLGCIWLFGFSIGVLITHFSYLFYFHRWWLERIEHLAETYQSTTKNILDTIDVKALSSMVSSMGMFGEMMGGVYSTTTTTTSRTSRM